MTPRLDTPLTAYPRDTWPAIVLEVCLAAGFFLEPGDAEDIIERMGPPFELPRVLKRARGLTFARSAAAEESSRSRQGHPRGEARKLLDWSETAAKAVKQQGWESPLARQAKGAQERRATAAAAAQAQLALAQSKAREKAEARALAKAMPRIQDTRLLDRIAALPVSLADLLRPTEVCELSDADAVARLAQYHRVLRGLTADRAAGKGLVAKRLYIMKRMGSAAAGELCRWERALAGRVREIRARERASRPPPLPKAAREAVTKPCRFTGTPAEARPSRPWLLRGVELDNLLSISAAERRRWIQEGRVPAVGHYEGRLPNGVGYYGTLHDPEVITALKPCIPEWRAERKAQLAEARREQRQFG